MSRPAAALEPAAAGAARPKIAFLDYCDVFEDFYPHYGVDQQAFATRWDATSSHAFVRLLQQEVGDVTWYELSLAPRVREARHETMGCRVRFVRSALAHRALWNAFYRPRASWRWRSRLFRQYALPASYLAPLSGDLRRAFAADRPDAIFVQDYATGKFDVLLAIARRLGIPLVAYHAGSVPDTYTGKLAKRWTIPRADLLIASSAGEQDHLARTYGIPADRLAVILTPIDTEAYSPLPHAEACAISGLDPGRRYLLFVGRLSEREKRIGALVEQFARLALRHEDVDLLVVGEGLDGERLRAAAAERAPGRVRFLGWVSGPERLAPLYAAAECLVLPSWKEGFPTVVGEAMACGTPVLASRVGGVPELVEQGRTGWLVPPGDDAALAEALEDVLAEPERTRGMRPAARHTAEQRVAPDVVARALRASFDRVLGSRG